MGFSEKESALKALQQHQEMFMDKPLHVAMWQPKTERSQLLKVRHNQRGGPNPHGMSPMMNNYGMQHMYPPRHMMRPMYRMSRGYPQPQMYQQIMAAARSGQHPPQTMPYPHYPMGQQQQQQQHLQRVPEQQPPAPVSGNQTLTAPELAAAPEAERKMMIGNSLYPKIGAICAEVHDPSELGVSDLAGKITGMLLD